MAIFVYCKECKKCVEPGSCKHEFNLNRESTGKYINMRKTWSKDTKVEFSTTTMDALIQKGRER
tara:strand:+ start:532 stop:723 length:192 start_codon:yes stop_codon:yes gene_type:complete